MVDRELNGIQAELGDERLSPADAAARIVEVVDRLGLQPVSLDDVPAPIEAHDLGVVCWMVVRPPEGQAQPSSSGAGHS